MQDKRNNVDNKHLYYMLSGGLPGYNSGLSPDNATVWNSDIITVVELLSVLPFGASIGNRNND